MKIYITGASGRLGREVARLLPKAVCLSIERSFLRNEIVTDFSYGQLKELLHDADVVIHLAGSLNFEDQKELQEVNVTLTRGLVEATPHDAKIIFSSSISVYGKKTEGTVNEETAANPDSEYAKSKYEAEQIVRKHGNSIVLRIATIYGREFDDYFRIIERIRNGKMVIFGDGRNRISFVHAEDVANAIKNAIDAPPGTYILSGEALEQASIYEIAANELGVKPPTMKIPLWLALNSFKVLRMFGKKPKIGEEHIRILASNRVFDYSKAGRVVGFTPRPLEQGIRELVRVFKEKNRK